MKSNETSAVSLTHSATEPSWIMTVSENHKDAKKALVIAYPGCIMFEVMLACELVSKTFPVELASLDGQAFLSTTGLRFEAQKAYERVTVDDYQCVLVPGGDTYDVIENPSLSGILQNANELGITIGAICAGPLLLAKAGILEGKQFTHGFGDHYQEFLAPFWAGANFVDEAVVRDGNIITAKPEAHIDFGASVAHLCGAIPVEKVEYYTRYYKGDRS